MRIGILFDLDGTLWDSGEGVAAAWNLALERLGRTERTSTEQVHSMMGKTSDVIAREMFPNETQAEADRMIDFCMNMENDYLREHGGILYEGLEDTLRALKNQGCFLSIVSNCQEGYIEAFLAYHGLEAYFDDTECYGHTLHGKGYNIRLVADRNGLENAVYLGDTMGDFEAAREADVSFLHAAYGFGSVPEGTPRIRDIRELPGAIRAFRWNDSALDKAGR